MVIIAELVGSTFGIGYQLRLSQDLFNMAAVVAWTLALVLFVAAELTVPPDASPTQLADLRRRVLATMATVKQATMSWQNTDA